MEIAWAAGLFEGGGSISGARLQLKMVNEESVRRFNAAVGVGKVYGPYGPYPSQMGRKPFYMWVAWYPEDIQAVADALRPYLSQSYAARLSPEGLSRADKPG